MNKYQFALLVVPEDQANKDLVIGARDSQPNTIQNKIRIEPVPGGRDEVWTATIHDYLPRLERYERWHLVLVIDHDADVPKIQQHFDELIPQSLKSRVWVLGCRSEPESCRSRLGRPGPLRELGSELFNSCMTQLSPLWDHNELNHNKAQLESLRKTLQNLIDQEKGS